jgi:hypothetical protein
MLRFIIKFLSHVFFPFQSEWNWYKDEAWYWPLSRNFMPYLHPMLNVQILDRETHNWVERVLHGRGGYDQGVTSKIRNYTVINNDVSAMGQHERAFLAAVEYAMDNYPERWPVYIKATPEQLNAAVENEREFTQSLFDLDYAITSELNPLQRRLIENENAKLLNDFLKGRK